MLKLSGALEKENEKSLLVWTGLKIVCIPKKAIIDIGINPDFPNTAIYYVQDWVTI